MAPPLRFIIFTLLLTRLNGETSHSPSSLVVYPPHPGASLSATFMVSVRMEDEGTSAVTRDPPVFVSASNDRCKQFLPHQQEKWCPMGHTQAFASFWFRGANALVTVTRVGGWGNWSQVNALCYRVFITNFNTIYIEV